VDIVINLQVSSIPVLIKAFPSPQYYISEISIRDAIEHTNEGDKIDSGY
jgi:hypothetical protein